MKIYVPTHTHTYIGHSRGREWVKSDWRGGGIGNSAPRPGNEEAKPFLRKLGHETKGEDLLYYYSIVIERRASLLLL